MRKAISLELVHETGDALCAAEVLGFSVSKVYSPVEASTDCYGSAGYTLADS